MDERTFGEFAHAIRTPMSVIRSTAEAILAGEPNEEVRDGLETIVKQVERMSQLLSEAGRSSPSQ